MCPSTKRNGWKKPIKLWEVFELLLWTVYQWLWCQMLHNGNLHVYGTQVGWKTSKFIILIFKECKVVRRVFIYLGFILIFTSMVVRSHKALQENHTIICLMNI